MKRLAILVLAGAGCSSAPEAPEARELPFAVVCTNWL